MREKRETRNNVSQKLIKARNGSKMETIALVHAKLFSDE
jgi:hypothetical protein